MSEIDEYRRLLSIGKLRAVGKRRAKVLMKRGEVVHAIYPHLNIWGWKRGNV